MEFEDKASLNKDGKKTKSSSFEVIYPSDYFSNLASLIRASHLQHQ